MPRRQRRTEPRPNPDEEASTSSMLHRFAQESRLNGGCTPYRARPTPIPGLFLCAHLQSCQPAVHPLREIVVVALLVDVAQLAIAVVYVEFQVPLQLAQANRAQMDGVAIHLVE